MSMSLPRSGWRQSGVVEIRLVAGDVATLDQAVAALRKGLTVTRVSPPRARRNNDGHTVYVDAIVPGDV